MRSPHLYAQLELIPLEQLAKLEAVSPWQHVCIWVNEFVDSSIKFLTGNQDPVIRVRHNRQNEVVYYVYDPVTGRSYNFSSAQAIRIWLDQRYYD
ncbi:MAG: hypothetical protein AAGF24_03540 [Cyanobacteria bacterium P01_H01_bin.121]